MSLADRVEDHGGNGASAEYDMETGGKATTPYVGRKVTNHTELLTLAGLDPDAWTIVGKIGQWTKTYHDRPDTYSFYFQFVPKEDSERAARDLAALIRAVKPRSQPIMSGLPMVVNLADGQIGKSGPDAPDHETIDAHFEATLAKVAGIVKSRKPRVLVLSDCGDPIENITSSAPNQIATNTLELPDQLRLWQRRLTQAILTLLPLCGRLIVASVPSNHGEVRNAQGKIGHGDYGLGVAMTVRDAFNIFRPDHGIEFVFPETKFDVNTYVDVEDTRVAFTHGDKAGAHHRIPQWIANQAASLRSPMAQARIVVHGHFHTPGYTESRGRAIVSCPMFDAGSDWFESLTGEYSTPGIAVFSIRNHLPFELQFVTPPGLEAA